MNLKDKTGYTSRIFKSLFFKYINDQKHENAPVIYAIA